MKVILTGSITGRRNGAPWPAKGEQIDLPDAEAASLISSGMAAAAPEAPAVPTPAPEVTSVEPEGEQATAVPQKATRARKAKS